MISAKEARVMADVVKVVLPNIDKCIRESAKNGRGGVCVDIDPNLVDIVSNPLEESGFEVRAYPVGESIRLAIGW